MRNVVLGVAAVVLGAAAAVAWGVTFTIENGVTANYSDLVKDAALRAEGLAPDGSPWAEGNIGNATGFGSHRMYPDVGAASGRGPRRYLTRFDLSGIPSNAAINSATMSLWYQRSGSNAEAISNYKLSRLQAGKAWVEGVGQYPAVDGSVTWNSQISYPVGNPARVLWATAGATGATDIDLGTTITFSKSGPGISEWKSFDITSWVQAWVNGSWQNNGMMLWGGVGTGVDAYYGIVGKEDTTYTSKPKIVVVYSLPGTAPTIDPIDNHDAKGGIPYTRQCTAQGTVPITWTLTPNATGAVIDANTGLVSGWTPTVGQVGNTYAFLVTASNGVSPDDTEAWDVTVVANPPVIVPVDDTSTLPGIAYTQQCSVSDGSLPIWWSPVPVQGPPGTVVDQDTGLVSGWTPAISDAGTTVTFTVQANNSFGAATETWGVRVLHRNNGFIVDYAYLTRDPTNGGQLRMYQEWDGSRAERLFPPAGNLLDDGTNWETLAFAGRGSNDDRLFIAKMTDGLDDILIEEINSAGATLNSANLSSIVGGSVGLAPVLGNIRYSSFHNTLFIGVNPDYWSDPTVNATAYEIDLALRTRIHTYQGEPLPATETGVTVEINPRNGTLYMTNTDMGDDTAFGLGDVIAFDTAGRTVGGTTTMASASVLVDGQTYNDFTYVYPSSAIYRAAANRTNDTLVIPTSPPGGGDSPVFEFYLDTTAHPVDGNGNLATRTNALATMRRGRCGRQDVKTGDIWLGSALGLYAIRSDDVVNRYEPTRSWFDADSPHVSVCSHPPQDIDNDGDVDLTDFGRFSACFNGPNRPWASGDDAKCSCLDANKDNDVDLSDFSVFAACFNGPNQPIPQPLCDNANGVGG